MRVVILGAGPAGLYLGYLLKRRRRDADVRIFEQNAADATFGFGVVFSDRALEFLNDDDPETFAAIAPHMESWEDITLAHRGERIAIDGVGFAAVGRLKLLQLLQERARSVGIEPTYEKAVTTLDDFAEADLVVGADGVNSLVRRTHEREFGATVTQLNNHFAWFGTTKPFSTLTQTFRETEFGHFNAHHYRYQPDMSTFIVEVDDATFKRGGFDHMNESEAKALCERVFAEALDGHKLISNHSIWRRFPIVRNEHWFHGNRVLVGDALHTAHFSIGSGTRLAMEDAIALDEVLTRHPRDIPSALAAYERARRPVLEKLVGGANASAAWYEHFADHMRLEPIDFAMSYVTRSGRIDIKRLRQLSPRFAARYERERPLAANH
ncbi:MAG TPA: FAD-dependent monooxygenase [Xanthobacteraceae bacterium]|nr:FAD-dependent monooxygenase [Xanthobacteraceae bacterium]